MMVPGGSWSTPQTVVALNQVGAEPNGYLELVLADNGAATVIWNEVYWSGSENKLEYSTIAPGVTQWSVPAPMPFYPANVVTDAMGNLTATADTSRVAMGTPIRVSTKLLGAPWSAPQVLSRPGTTNTVSSVIMNKAGAAAVSWIEEATNCANLPCPGLRALFVATKARLAAWQAARTVSIPTCDAVGGNVKLNSVGQASVYFFCRESRSLTPVDSFRVARQNATGVWNTPLNLGNLPLYGGSPGSYYTTWAVDDLGRITYATSLSPNTIEVTFLDAGGVKIKSEQIAISTTTAKDMYISSVSASPDGSLVAINFYERFGPFAGVKRNGVPYFYYTAVNHNAIFSTAIVPTRVFLGNTPGGFEIISALSDGVALAKHIIPFWPLTLESFKYAIFSLNNPPSSTLAVSKTGVGTITSSQAGINCGTVCAAPFSTTSIVTLNATPAAGYTFTGWSGACVGTGACSVAMAMAKSVVATFTAAAASLPTVTLVAIDPTATEAGPTTGTFTVTRTGSTATALAVNLTYGGTATPGVDRLLMPLTVIIPAGAVSATITITPIDDALVEPNETTIATLSANAAYSLGTATTATVTIISND
jgi:Divergent InlB B-repeat domain